MIHFAFLAAAVFWLSRRGRAYFWRALAWFSAGIVANAFYGVLQLLDARRGANLDASVLSPITGGASQINVYGAINGANVYRPNAMTGDPNHLGIMLIVPLLILTPLYLRLEKGHRMRKWLMVTIGFLLVVEAATLSRSGILGLGVGALVLAVPYRHYLRSRALLVPVGAALALLLAIVLSRKSFFTTVLKSRVQTSGGSENAHFQVYSFIPHVLHTDPLFGLGLNTFSVYYEFVTGKTNWGPHSLLRRADRRDRHRRDGALRGIPLVGLPQASRRTGARAGARGRARSTGRTCPSARLGLHRSARRNARLERLLPDDAVLLLLRVRRARTGGSGRLRPQRMKVVVLTTSYPRDASDVAGSFVASAVEGVRALGVEVDVVSPSSFQDFGIAYGGGIAQNLRAAPWKVALVPAFMATYGRAARRAARDADLVHAHWIPSAIAARMAGKPYVLQVWGTDVELARRAPALFRPLLRGARIVLAASTFLAEEARRLGAREVRVIPFGVTIPGPPAPPAEPPHVLFAGRLSEEKGILEFVEATEGLERVIVGDGPLRAQAPGAVGFVPPSEIGAWYERAAVVCVPSRREGYGIGAREAMAYGRAVVAARVGGLCDLEHVEFVPPRDPAALRTAVRGLLADDARRAELGSAARVEAAGFSHAAAADSLAAAYRAALGS